MERWMQTCQRELLDRVPIWNQPHLLRALREFGQFYNAHRPIRASRTPDCSTRCQRRSRRLPKSPASAYNDATDSADYSMSTNTQHEMHECSFRQRQVIR
jgi:hypothetical protein